MPDLKTSIKLSLVGGPEWNIEHRQTIDAYDIVEVILDPGTTDRVVETSAGARRRGSTCSRSSPASTARRSRSSPATAAAIRAPSRCSGPRSTATAARPCSTVVPRSIKLSHQPRGGHSPSVPACRS
ncbi:MAG: hypothetical protein MZW92_65545 [Comamonadaceae bacterium]|nr:hypothetical protein [Comamonadaceae bacterium]